MQGSRGHSRVGPRDDGVAFVIEDEVLCRRFSGDFFHAATSTRQAGYGFNPHRILGRSASEDVVDNLALRLMRLHDWPVSRRAGLSAMPYEKMLDHGIHFTVSFLLEFGVGQVTEPVDALCLQQRRLSFVSEALQFFAFRLWCHRRRPRGNALRVA